MDLYHRVLCMQFGLSSQKPFLNLMPVVVVDQESFQCQISFQISFMFSLLLHNIISGLSDKNVIKYRHETPNNILEAYQSTIKVVSTLSVLALNL